MEVIKKYKCEICENEYDSEKDAIDCEARGLEKPICSKGKQVDYFYEVGGGFSHWILNAYVAKIFHKGHNCNYHIKGIYDNGKKYMLNDDIYCNLIFKQKCRFHNNK